MERFRRTGLRGRGKGRGKNRFLMGAAILSVSGLICKVIGAFYRIPLQNNILGLDGISLYQLAYPVYSMLLVISTSGLATAISKMVAERVVQQDFRGAYRTFKISRNVLIVIGLVTTLIMILGNDLITAIQGDPLAAPVNLAIAPALFFVSLMSAYRGYFQGMQDMVPTGVSQLLEQVGKLAIGFPLAALGMQLGAQQGAGLAAQQARELSIQYGAAGAMLGVTLSEVVALLFVMAMHLRRRKELKRRERWQKEYTPVPAKPLVIRMIKLAIPVTLGASVMPLLFYIDSAMVVRILTGTGYSQETARNLYGLLSGPVNTLMNLPAVITIALSMSLVPAISGAWVRQDFRELGEKTTTGLRLALMLGLPAAVGLFLLARQILTLLYASSVASNMDQAVSLLRITSFSVVFLSVVQSMTGVLQGTGRVMIPVRNLAIGALCKIAVSWTLLSIPSINIQGSALGTLTCFVVAGTLNLVEAMRCTHARFSIQKVILRPAAAALSMGVAVWACVRFLGSHLGNTTLTALAILVGAGVYAVLLVAFGAITRSDVRLVLGARLGDKLARFIPERGAAARRSSHR